MLSQHVLFLEEANSGAKPTAHIVLPPPKVQPLQDALAEAMLEDNPAHQRRSPLDWVVSFAVHTSVVIALVILPLYFTQALDLHKFNMTFLVAPMPPPPPPPPKVPSAVPRATHIVPIRMFRSGKLTAPSFIPKNVVITGPEESLPPEEISGGVPGGVPGGLLGGLLGGVPGGALNRAPAPAVAEGPKKPLRVGGNVKPPKLLFGPDPEYPTLAQQARISGTVIVEAIINEHGDVIQVRAVSGHPLLIPPALKAVSVRKYEPTMLDGEPVPLDLTVVVKFTL